MMVSRYRRYGPHPPRRPTSKSAARPDRPRRSSGRWLARAAPHPIRAQFGRRIGMSGEIPQDPGDPLRIQGFPAGALTDHGREPAYAVPIGRAGLGNGHRRACPIGADTAGLHDRHLDPEGGKFPGKHQREPADRELGAVIGREARSGEPRNHGSDLQDMPRVLFAQQRDDRRAAVDHSIEVGVDLTPVVVERDVLDRRDVGIAAVVGDDVDPFISVVSAADGLDRHPGIGDVERQGKDAAAMVGDDILQRLRMSRGGDTRSPAASAASTMSRPRPRELPVTNQTLLTDRRRLSPYHRPCGALHQPGAGCAGV